MADRRTTMGPIIDDTVATGGTPGSISGNIPPTPSTILDIKAVADRHYVSGDPYYWYSNLSRALPWALDDVSRDFGVDIYSRMLLDSQVRSVVNVFKASILEDGISLAPAITEKDDPDYQQAADLADAAERMLDDLAVPFDDVLWDMLDACALGNRMAEQVYDLDTTTSGKQQYVLQSLGVKPYESVAFVVDVYLNTVGILGRVAGQPLGIQQGILLSELKDSPNLLPRSKFAILTFRPRNGDPRGTSLLRPAFDPWNQKQQLKKEYLKYLTQFATPSLVGFTAEGAEPYQLSNADGSPMLDAYGNPALQSPEDDMLAALQNFANGTATAFPFGAAVKPIEMNGNGEAFLNAFQYHDMQITKAVLHQTLSTEEGEHQSRAASGTHKDILDTIVRQAKRSVERMVTRDILHTWMRLNGNGDILDLTPQATLGTAESEDYASLWTAASTLQGSDYLHSSQYAELDEMLGLPERTPADATTAPVKEAVNVAVVGGTVTPPDTSTGEKTVATTSAAKEPVPEGSSAAMSASPSDAAPLRSIFDDLMDELE